MKLTFAKIIITTILAWGMAGPAWTQETNSQSDQVTTESPRTTKPEKTARFDTKTAEDPAKSETDIAKRLDNSADVLKEIMETPDKGIPTNVFADAKCIAVVPSMIHIAVGFGGDMERA